ncbi:Lrp/AsnC ligand binding domain-containing protein [Halobellus sp. GM3]|uniref:Lrp/AsnC ligand binding domain-containing protein n=1 Tax=Halobellus sp. GM3 TaxID=3458410 RepID=UPI00403E19D4
MVTAYILVKASTGDVDRLTSAIDALDDGIDSVSVVAGDVDYIVKVNVDGPGDVREIATSIHEMSGIENTQTYIAME